MLEKVLDTLKKFFSSVTGIIGLLVMLVGAIVLFLQNSHLTLLLIFALGELAALVSFIAIWLERNPQPVLVEKSLPKHPNLRLWVGAGILVMLMLDGWFFLSPRGEQFITDLRMGVPRSTTTRAAFEINLIGLPYQSDVSEEVLSDTYYVTDAMVRTRGNLSAYDDFSLTPLQVEIIPHYSGNEKFANLVLRVSGQGGSKDIPLWNEFDHDSGPRTITLDLPSIIVLSGIKETRNEIETSLGLESHPYQQATLRFEVIRLAHNDSALAERTLEIENTPWVQRARIVNRNGFTLDYSLENFAARATFYCHVVIGKATADVDASDHSFWSGTEVVKDLECDPFVLDYRGRENQSIPLDASTIGYDLDHGRYIVQVFTIAERSDVMFKDGLTYQTSSEAWVLANSSHLLTFVICNDPGKTCEETDTLAVEEERVRAFPFDSKSEAGNGETYFAVRTYPLGNRAANRYFLDYWLDPEKDGWAGLGLWFEDLVDVSHFSRVRFKLTLDESPDVIWLDVKWKSGDDFATSRVFVGDGAYGTRTSEEQVVVIPFSAFSEVDWTAVDSLYFGLDSSHVPDAGKHTLQVAEIEFVR